MPRIRKKTSNRTKIFDRVKLKKKVKETKRKTARAAKKNPQWKSKNKDPGIPNDFPYKDQILAEVNEQRRIELEEKERKKEENRLARLKAKGIQSEAIEAEDDETIEQGDEEEEEEIDAPKATKKDLNVGIDAIQSLSAKIIPAQMKSRPAPVAVEQSGDEEEVPALVNRDLPTLKSVLEVSDLLLHVIDARDPLEYRSQYLENVAKEHGMKFAFVLTKIDTCPREAVSAWLTQLRSQHPTFLFKAASAFLPPPAATSTQAITKGKGKSPAADALGTESLIGYLSHLAQEKQGDAPLTVAVAGVTNVGKSSFINSLARRSALPVYSVSETTRGATTTALPQEVVIEASGKEVRIIDTPGLSFELDHSSADKGKQRGRDILLRSRGRIDKLKDPAPPISYIISRANNEDLMLLYNLAAFAKDDPTAFLSGVARANQLIKRKGDLDLAGASRTVLHHWSTGKFSRYATPSKGTASLDAASSLASSSSTSEAWLTSLYALADEAILSTLTPRKELRKAIGLVRFTPGSIDDRNVNIEEEWATLDAEKNVGSDEDEDEDEDGDLEMTEELGDDDDEEDDDDDEDEEGSEEDEEEVIPLSKLKKRKRGSNPLPPPKKVAFAAAASSSRKRSKISSKPQNEDESAPSSILKKQEAPARASKKARTSKVEEPAPSAVGGPANVRPAKKRQLTKPVRIANATTSNKNKTPVAQASEAYDFGQFF